MIDVFPFTGQPVAIFGLGRSGLAAAEALKQSGADVWAWDDDETSRAGAAKAGVPLVDLYRCQWEKPTALVLSPGVPLHSPKPHPLVGMAKAAGCEVVGDIELLARSQRDCAYIGITGTNGKSTTTALIGHMLRTSGRQTEVGGNLGQPVLELAPLDAEGVYVVEMSSFQLELTFSITFDVAVLLNISADHLERHGGMGGYLKAKKQIFNRQAAPRTAVVGIDDDYSLAIYEELKAKGEQVPIPISCQGPVDGGVYAKNGMLIDAIESPATPVIDLKGLSTLPGKHNWQNAAAAYAAAKTAGLDATAMREGLESYPGLAHRQELVAVINGISYINDSKATNADAAAKALACYQAIYWIAGGRAKEGGIEMLEPHLSSLRHAFVIGEAAGALAAALRGKADVTRSGNLASAVKEARAMALREGAKDAVVLFSPACASFDQFKDFEARGEAFRELVMSLPSYPDG